MTFRERLADWISGGALTKLNRRLLFSERRVTEAKIDAMMEAEQTKSVLNRETATHYRHDARLDALDATIAKRSRALTMILTATEHDKSGTAPWIARIAREGLE